jgi:hypothetical protein
MNGGWHAPRRFRAPWSVRELEQAFVVQDANGQAVAYTYFRKNENEARQANVLTHDEALRIASNIGKAARAAIPQGRGMTGRPEIVQTRGRTGGSSWRRGTEQIYRWCSEGASRASDL